jgi:uncharacterized protein
MRGHLSNRLPAIWAFALLGFAAVAAARDVPYLAGRVNDTAGIIPAESRQRLDTALAAVEKDSGAQVAVLTVESLDGDSLEDFSHRVAQTWKLGRKGVDDGVLFLVAKGDRKMRIEVGYGLESKLPDALCGRILDNVVRPRFRAGEFGGGIEAGVEAIAGTLAGKDVVPKSAPSTAQPLGFAGSLLFGFIFLVVITPFSLIALFGSGGMSWFLYFFLMPFWGAFPIAILGPGALVALVAWVIGFPIFKIWLRAAGGKAFVKAHPKWTSAMVSSGGSSSHRGWSSGGSSSGFSGGGGSFGGGGASSSW